MIDKVQIESRINELGSIQPWNHDFELPHGIRTRPGNQISHGKNHVKQKRLQPLFDIIGLNGKTVLDVGCNEGFFSLHMAKAGAHVIGIDVDEKRIEKARFILDTLENNYDIRYELMDIYSQTFKILPRFDICLCFGFIHRVPDPYRALAALSDRSDMIIFEWKALKSGPHDEPYAYFSEKGVNKDDYYGTEYWLLSFSAVERILKRLEFKYFYRIDEPEQKRAILVAGRKHHQIFNMPDKVSRGKRVITFLRHTKRYIKTVHGILLGNINA